LGVMVENKRIYNTKKIALSGGTVKPNQTLNSAQTSGNSMLAENSRQNIFKSSEIKVENSDLILDCPECKNKQN
jgi:hypothetical protein